MSPRGVAIPDLRDRLFTAAERVVARDGASALTSRAVTDEAGCAKGVLHTHFSGLDEFISQLVLDRFARSARHAQQLTGRAGQGLVADNLAEVALALLDSLPAAVVSLAMTRPGASLHTRQALEAGAPGFTAMQESIVGYLEAERHLGRVAQDIDAVTTALALVGTVHHLLMTRSPGDPSDARQTTERLVALLLCERSHPARPS
ncbi:TetR family transcriptional regulator [Streptomyces sp. NPDC058739]|uniref:TetR family transcriptional regulator n=1 Tax=Streptomyces sp. NPDC058739 TaxID=3346618 RepID=UPI0036C6F9C7